MLDVVRGERQRHGRLQPVYVIGRVLWQRGAG